MNLIYDDWVRPKKARDYPPVCGHGIVDKNYLKYSKKRVCPYYKTWRSMLERCFDSKIRDRSRCWESTCCEEWLFFDNFKAWMETQYWGQGLMLDKDILVKGNKEYSPETCSFIPQYLNSGFQIKGQDKMSKCGFMGVSMSNDTKRAKPFVVCSIKDIDTKKMIYGGRFYTAEEAHITWQKIKVDNLSKLLVKYSKETFFNTRVACAVNKRIWDIQVQVSRGERTTNP